MINFENMDRKKLKAWSIFFCLLGDWIIAAYAYITVVQGKKFFEKIFTTVAQTQGIDMEGIDNSLVEEFFQKSVKITISMIALYLIINMLCYVFYYYDKGFGKLYVKSLAYMGTFFFAIFALTSLDKPIFATTLLIQTFLYLFIIIGHKKIKNKE